MLNKLKINTKILAMVAGAFLVCSVLVAGASWSLNQSRMLDLAKSSYHQISHLLATNMAGHVKFGKADNLNSEFALLSENEDLAMDYAAAFTLEGAMITELNVASVEGELVTASVAQVLETREASLVIDGPHVIAVFPTLFGNDAAMVGALALVYDLSAIQAEAANVGLFAALIAFAVSGVALVALAFALHRLVGGPIARLAGQTQKIADGDLEQDVQGLRRGDELGALAKAVEVFREKSKNLVAMQSDTDRYLEEAADAQGQIDAISKSQAVIEFTTDGTIVRANDNFLGAMGYSMSEIQGKHHSMFVEPGYANSSDYENFWHQLREGQFQAAEYPRVGKGGKIVWIQASYNPIFDTEGRVTKVVKYATDITGRKVAVERLSSALDKLADGNLDARIDEHFIPDFEAVREALNSTVARLQDVIGQLRSTSSGVKMATGEILSGANDLSERTTKQAATIEETSATMEQLATTVRQNAMKAESASKNANDVAHSAQEGGEVMAKATDAMEKITNSSSKISNIIGMIDDIAFQTNLLALNASVEAARAGEAGKGFAVVAVEVRRLAQSAAEASSEVKALIEQSAEEVSSGSKLVAVASEKLISMLEAVQQNTAQMREIAVASQEQASSIDEVNAAVRQLDEMTQHNAALVEETNAAIEQTENQASELDRIVERFRFAGSSNAVHAAAPKPVSKPVPQGKATGIQGLKDKVKQAAKSYLTAGNAAVDEDWSEF